jgi:hypothetical protein
MDSVVERLKMAQPLYSTNNKYFDRALADLAKEFLAEQAFIRISTRYFSYAWMEGY